MFGSGGEECASGCGNVMGEGLKISTGLCLGQDCRTPRLSKFLPAALALGGPIIHQLSLICNVYKDRTLIF